MNNSTTNMINTTNIISNNVETINNNLITINYEQPNENDFIQTELLYKTIKDDFNLYESQEDTIKRQVVLSKLKSLIQNFVIQVGKSKGIPEEDCKPGGNIYSFGSYRLGVHGPGADIDVLCVAPDYVDRNKHFFNDLLNIFKSNTDITEICDVQDAYVPVIKMKYSEIQIDLLFANLHFRQISESLDLKENNILKNCDKESILSLNGSRVTDQILTLVPNKENFILTLKSIKLWASSRGLYSNAFGYCGGVAYAILTAKICQMFPNYKPNKLLYMFFTIYSEWDFSKNPIMLNEIIKDVGFKVDLDVFNLETAKYNIAVITPAFPAMNSTHNVSETTKRVLINEFNFSKNLIDLINNQNKLPWKVLFTKFNIFEKYNAFLQIDILSSNEKDFKKWLGFVESKLRLLIKFLEDIYQIRTHPYPDNFNITDSKYLYAKAFFFGIQFINPDSSIIKDELKKEQYMKIFLREPISKFCAKLNDPKIRNSNTMNMRIRDKRKNNIPKDVLREYSNVNFNKINNKSLFSSLSDYEIYKKLEGNYFKSVVDNSAL